MSKDNNLEYRAVTLELSSVDVATRKIEGRAIVFNSLSKPLKTRNGDTFKEYILPGALSKSLKENDIRALKEHEPLFLLGRTSAGTLHLEERDDGLYCTIDVPDTTFGNDTLVQAKRGDLRGFSFAFTPVKQRTYFKGTDRLRELVEIDVSEVSIVSNPAYPETTLAVRSEDFINEDHKEERKEEPATEVAAPAPVVPENKETEKRDETPAPPAIDKLTHGFYERKMRLYNLRDKQFEEAKPL